MADKPPTDDQSTGRQSSPKKHVELKTQKQEVVE